MQNLVTIREVLKFGDFLRILGEVQRLFRKFEVRRPPEIFWKSSVTIWIINTKTF